MPEMVFTVQWPDGAQERCYSPSTVIEQHLVAGSSYPLGEFLARARTALDAASERVRAKYGFRCSSADDQLAILEERAAGFAGAAEALVRVLSLEKKIP